MHFQICPPIYYYRNVIVPGDNKTMEEHIILQSSHDHFYHLIRVTVMVFNATFNNISDKSWWSVLLMEETRVPTENQWPAASHWQTLSHNDVFKVHLAWVEFELTVLVVIGNDCISSCKSNYHKIMTTTAPFIFLKYKIIFDSSISYLAPFMGNFWTFPQCNMIL